MGREMVTCEPCGKRIPAEISQIDDNGCIACPAAFTEDGSGSCPSRDAREERWQATLVRNALRKPGTPVHVSCERKERP